MSTLNDVTIPSSDWVSAYTISGITPTSTIKIVNKSSSYILVQIAPTKPLDSNNSGILIYPPPEMTSSITVTGESEVWLKATNFNAVANIGEA